jgi:hypothetical protein
MKPVADAVRVFQVAKRKEVANAGKESAKNRAVFLAKIGTCQRISTILGILLLPDFSTQSWTIEMTPRDRRAANAPCRLQGIVHLEE